MLSIIWNDEPNENVEHIEEHGLDIEDVEYVLDNPTAADESHSTGRPCVFGYTPGGRYIIVLFDKIDEDTIYPVSAYDVPEPS